MNRLLIVLTFFLVAACIGTSANLNKVSLGMTKIEVVNAIGTPDSVSAQGNVEYMIYHWASPKQLIADENNLDRYFIRLTDGRVDAYGEKGDFDSTQDPTIIIQVED